MFSKKALILAGAAFLITAGGALAEHPASSSNCEECHIYGSTAVAPKVMPPKPGFFGKIMGEVDLRGHQKVGCSGGPTPDGKLSGCHSIESKFAKYLAVDTTDKPVDILCAKCHAETSAVGAHHPSYKSDKDGNGVPETFVVVNDKRDAAGKLSPKSQKEPLRSAPDSFAMVEQADGSKKLGAAVPLSTFTEIVEKEKKVFERVVVCTSCHNPHFGFLSGTGKMETFEKSDRKQGDALLRLRDQNNTLCLACHA
ncbi:hypothetical protein FDZ71_00250 [bacterium]|nr:MAG: hypothetical protein FDZ71_00250 [bacterium]